MLKGSVVPSQIKNKAKRSQVYQEQKAEKKKEKKQQRQKRKREEEEAEASGTPAPPKKEQRTLENVREFDETIVQPDDQEVLQDEATDELSNYAHGHTPKVLITTSIKPVGDAFKFCDQLLSIIPNSEFRTRGKYDIKEIVQFCKNRDFTDILIVHEERKEPDALTVIHLPDGPTAYFKLTSVRCPKEISDHARATDHTPELILNNFNTRLGHQVGRLLAALFPHQPQFTGRQVVTWHNQRDFIFFRRHRYVFKEDGKRAGLQEIGPQFCLKLQWLQKGTFDKKFGNYEWHHKAELDTSRRRFFL